MKYKKCAIRTQQWRLVNNTELFDITKDPGEKYNVAKQHPKVVAKLQQEYNQWWESCLPYMVNEDLPELESEDFHFPKLYQEQLLKGEIKEWDLTYE